MHEACGVEQDVDGADVFRHRGDGCGIAHVEPRHLGHAIPGEQRQPLFVDVGCNNRGALARKGHRTGAANSHRARGDERALALQAVSHVVSP